MFDLTLDRIWSLSSGLLHSAISGSRALANLWYDGLLTGEGSIAYSSELLVNGDFTDGLNGWNIYNVGGSSSITTSNGQLVFDYVSSDNTATSFNQNSVHQVEGVYEVTINVDSITGSIKLQDGDSNALYGIVSTAGTHTFRAYADDSGFWVYRNSSAESVTAVINSISVRRISDGRLRNRGTDGQTENLQVLSGGTTAFDGVGQYTPTGNNTSLDTGSVLVGFVPTGTGTRYIFGKQGAVRLYARLSSASTLQLGLGGSFITTSVTLLTSKTTIVINWNQGNWEITSSDGQYDSGTYIGSVTETSVLDIGRHPTLGGYFDGEVFGFIQLNKTLTSSEISYAYQQPEKFFAHCNANDPYIDSNLSFAQSDCKLNIPLDAKGEYQIDFAQAFSSELVVNGDFDDNSWWTTEASWSISGGSANCNGLNRMFTPSGTVATGTFVLVEYEIKNYVSGNIRPYVGNDTSQTGIFRAANGVYRDILYNTQANTRLYFRYGDISFNGSIDNVSVKQVTAHQISGYTTSCDVVKQSYGRQLINFENVFGDYKPDRMWFDGDEYVDSDLSTSFIPTVEPFAVEAILYNDGSGIVQDVGSNNDYFRKFSDGRVYLSFNQGFVANFIMPQGFFWVAFRSEGENFTFYMNDQSSSGVRTESESTIPWRLGNSTINPERNSNTNQKIWHGDNYAKFDPDKAWEEAQVKIAQLEANS